MDAASVGSLGTVMKLIEKKKVNVDARNKDGLTALMVAVYYGHLPVMMYLMKMSCDVNLSDNVSLSLFPSSVVWRTNQVFSLVHSVIILL